jgi:diguanylate cyclase (GGDEF)-like protein/PAS domain S-box-containing protein
MMSKAYYAPSVLDEEYTSLIEAIPDVIFLKDGAGRWLITNGAAKTLFRLHEFDWQGKTDKELADENPEMQSIHMECIEDDEAAWVVGKLLVFDKTIIDEAGNVREYEVRKYPTFNDDGTRKSLVVIGRDVSEARLTERNLRVADTAIESQEAIVITDANNRILRINSAFTRMTGYSKEDAIGKTTALLNSGRHDEAYYQRMWEALATKRSWQGEIWDRRKNGQIYLKWLTITAVSGSDGKIHNYIGTFTDLSEHKEAKEAIYRLAYYDPLTDLPNRRLLLDHMDSALKNSTHNLHNGALLMIDLDNFKFINDTKGHAIGDLLLIEVAKRLKSCVRDGDIVARWGGDEFVIMLNILGKDANKAALQAEVSSKNIINISNQPILITGEEIHCTFSVGISMFTVPMTSSDEILKRADIAMYQAKAAGRNTISFFDPVAYALIEERQIVLSELHQALPSEQLKLYFQVQVVQTNRECKVMGAEVLLRWQHPQRGLVSPAEFIPQAEESGLIIPIGLWMLVNVCMQLKTWEANPMTQSLTLSVNVSARQFSQPDFVEQVCKVLERTGAKATQLKIELTESLVLDDVADTIEKMKALKLLGVNFSIDDFGTGYSSLSYLKKLPINQLKIDQSFVREIDTDHSDAIIVQTIIGMAHNFGFNVIAEGVETKAQRDCLVRYGCNAFQGYLFSKPVPLEDFEKLISEIIKPDLSAN